MWGVTCSLTRIGDNRHHWWDVLAGTVLGLFFGMLTVATLCRKFRFERKLQQNCGDPLENGQMCFNEKTHQGVKKLLNDQTIDVSEGRELRNISTSWKE